MRFLFVGRNDSHLEYSAFLREIVIVAECQATGELDMTLLFPDGMDAGCACDEQTMCPTGDDTECVRVPSSYPPRREIL